MFCLKKKKVQQSMAAHCLVGSLRWVWKLNETRVENHKCLKYFSHAQMNISQTACTNE